MDVLGFEVTLFPSDNIFLLKHPDKSSTLEDAYKVLKILNNSVETEYLKVILYRIPGYYFSYNIKTKKGIVLGNSDIKETLKRTKNA